MSEKCDVRIFQFCQVVQEHKLFEVAYFDCLLYR